MSRAASNRPMRVDQIARGIFGRAAEARTTGDAALALRVCAELEEIESEYELRLRATHAVPVRLEPRLIESQYAGRCLTCRKPYAPGEPVRWARGRGAVCVGCRFSGEG